MEQTTACKYETLLQKFSKVCKERDELKKKASLESVKTLKISPDDTIIATVDPEKYYFNEARQMGQELSRMFPSNKIIILASGIDISIKQEEKGNEGD